MDNCIGHQCHVYRITWRPPGKSYETLEDLTFCPECVLFKCPCLGIHVTSGVNVSFVPLAGLTAKVTAVPVVREKAVVREKGFRIEP